MTSPEENNLSAEAIEHVKKHQKELVDHFVGKVTPVGRPVSIFMAGSPGAGKTEFSTRLINEIMGAEDKIVQIDPDAIRLWLPQYEPGKAHLFQGAVALGVNKLHDYVKSKSYSFLLDGTFSKIDQARNNIDLSLSKDRPIFIEYVLQPPEIAWKFTQDREKVDGRNIQREDFIEQFIAARDNVATIKREYGNRVRVDLIERNLKTKQYKITFNIDNLDTYLPKKYSKDEIESLI
ncbi:MAG: zeta toxin family protein [Candidatus Nomurabacteria bacterium]|nr:MAG: zeta toxin family protein [Candidatus Nomurabacteria bacterium]